MSIKKILSLFLSLNLITIMIGSGYLSTQAKILGVNAEPGTLSYQNQNCKIDYKVGDWTDICPIKKFNPKDGVLKKVKMEVLAEAMSDIMIENKNVIPANPKITSSSKITVDDQSGTNLVSMEINKTFDFKLTAYDGNLDFAGPSGISELDTKSGINSKIVEITDPNLINKFIGFNEENRLKVLLDSNTSAFSSNNFATNLSQATELKALSVYYQYEQGDLMLTSKVDKSTYKAGDKLTYSYSVKNNDTEKTSGPSKLNINLGDSVKYISNSNSDWKCTIEGKNLSCENLKSIESGSISNLDIVVEVLDNGSKQIENSAEVIYYTGEYNYNNNKSIVFAYSSNDNNSKTDPVARDCDLGLLDSKQTFTIQLRTIDCMYGSDREGDSTIKNYIVTRLPDPRNGLLKYGTEDLKVGQELSKSDLIKVQLITNEVCDENNFFEYTVSDNSDLKDTSAAKVQWRCGPSGYDNDLELVKYTQGEFRELALGRYVIRVRNLAQKTWNGKVRITDKLPENMSVTWITVPNGWNCDGNGTKNVTCEASNNYTIEPLNDTFIEVQVWVSPSDTKVVQNEACLDPLIINENPKNNCGRVETFLGSFVPPKVDSITKTEEKGSLEVPNKNTTPTPSNPSTTPNPKPTTPSNNAPKTEPKPIISKEIKNGLTRTGGYLLAGIVGINLVLIAGIIVFKKMRKN
ncbi:MAG: choice-of-anchor E domain-containing protein [Patescibacteria group bacterium]